MVGVVVVLMTLTSAAQLTAIATAPEVLLVELLSTPALTPAVLVMPGQFEIDVVAVSVIVLVAFLAIVPKAQVSVFPPAMGELGEQAPASGPDTVQLRPLGRTSARATWVELAGPLAVTVMP